MNLSTAFGLLLGVAVIYYGTTTSTPNFQIFLNFHAFVIVCGGTLAATLVSFPVPLLIKVVKVFLNRIAGKSIAPHIKVVEEIIRLAKGQYNDSNFLVTAIPTIKTPFLREAVQLQTDGGMSDGKIDVIIRKRAEVHLVRYEADSHVFKTMARFPPAFGLLGATLGMIALMSNLGSPESFSTMGPAMAIALVATMYGIAIANFIFIPLGENLGKHSKEDHLMRNIVIDAIKLLREKEHPLVVEEYLQSYLLTSERMLLKNTKKAA